MQIQQLLFNAENPLLAQPIMQMPVTASNSLFDRPTEGDILSQAMNSTLFD
jgi:hypothetical protein